MDVSKKLKETLTELILVSSWHGIPAIVRTKRIFFKLMWFMFLIGCASYCFYLIFNTINDYLDYDVVTKIELYKEILSEFPAVTLCNLNSIYYSYNLNSTILSCQFNAQNCNLNEFKWYFDSYYGNCFSFNSGYNQTNQKIPIKKSNIAGMWYGLKLLLFTGPPKPVSSAGFHIFIHNSTVNPDFNSGVDIPVGFTTKLALRRDYYENQGEPYNNCKTDLTKPDSFNSDIYRTILNEGLVYNQKNCIFYLSFTKIAEKCNCSTSLTNMTKDCIEKDKFCSFYWYQKFYVDENIETLKELCPYECNTIDYIITTSTSDIQYLTFGYQVKARPDILSQYDNETLTNDLLKKSVLEVQVFYEDLSYKLISQSAKTSPTDLVSNIGGLLGLFIGTSFLSFAEIIEVVLELIFICFEHRKNRIIKL